jgi:hypothetical protein
VLSQFRSFDPVTIDIYGYDETFLFTDPPELSNSMKSSTDDMIDSLVNIVTIQSSGAPGIKMVSIFLGTNTTFVLSSLPIYKYKIM